MTTRLNCRRDQESNYQMTLMHRTLSLLTLNDTGDKDLGRWCHSWSEESHAFDAALDALGKLEKSIAEAGGSSQSVLSVLVWLWWPSCLIKFRFITMIIYECLSMSMIYYLYHEYGQCPPEVKASAKQRQGWRLRRDDDHGEDTLGSASTKHSSVDNEAGSLTNLLKGSGFLGCFTRVIPKVEWSKRHELMNLKFAAADYTGWRVRHVKTCRR